MTEVRTETVVLVIIIQDGPLCVFISPGNIESGFFVAPRSRDIILLGDPLVKCKVNPIGSALLQLCKRNILRIPVARQEIAPEYLLGFFHGRCPANTRVSY